MSERKGRLMPVAQYGESATRTALEGGTPYPQGFAWNACLQAHAQFSRDYANDPYSLESLRGVVGPVVLAVPVGHDGAYRSAITLHYPDDVHVSPADVTLLTNVCRHLGIALSAARSTALQAGLLGLYARVMEAETDDLYQQVLDTAILHVPGAERGSLLVRKHHEQPFRYVAASGFDFEELRKVTFTEQQMRSWYAEGPEEWRLGRARILRSDELDLATFSRQSGGAELPAGAAALEAIKSNACLPVPYHGRVLAMLNLDNFTREHAFAEDSLSTLALFGPALSSLLAGAQYRDEIVRASRTDTLTGLANREGFQLTLERHHARSLRSGVPYTILSMDLTGFKAVNDQLGHAAGDAALRLVADALENASRPGDTVSRWGGDEFIALLPGTTSEEAAKVCARFERAVSGLEVDGLRLGVDIGRATFGEDARTVAELLRVSDARMYANKAAGKAVATARA